MDGSELSEEHLKDYVSAGAELLDRKRPDWFLRVNLDKLDLGSGYECVLGQLYGAYASGVDRLELDWDADEPTRLGFSAHGLPGGDLNYPELTELWLDQIQYRLDHPAEFRIDE